MDPFIEHYGFVHSRYDEAEVVNDELFVGVKYTSESSLVVAPRGEKCFGKMVIIFACNFADKGLILCCDLFFNVGYIEEFIPHCLICDALLFNLSHIDA